MISDKLLSVMGNSDTPATTMTYSEFVTKVNSLGLNDYVYTTSLIGDVVLRPPYTDTIAGTMFGSPWGGRFFVNNVAGKGILVRHIMPNEETAVDQINNGRIMVLTMDSTGQSNVLGLTRNGGTSFDRTNLLRPSQIHKVVYWDVKRSCARMINPRLMTSPVDYEFP